MRRWLALAGFLLSGCVTWSPLVSMIDLPNWFPTPDGKEAVAVIAIELPSMCTLQVETQSDVVSVRPDYQTVIAQDCRPWDGMGDATVWWVMVEDGAVGRGAPEVVATEEQAVQHFRTNSARLASASESLRSFVAKAKMYPDTPIRVVGHTDSRGSAPYNLRLGMSRAQAVAKWLVAQGIDRQRIELASKGLDQPVATNGSAAGRAVNRRAEAVITLVVTGGPGA